MHDCMRIRGFNLVAGIGVMLALALAGCGGGAGSAVGVSTDPGGGIGSTGPGSATGSTSSGSTTGSGGTVSTGGTTTSGGTTGSGGSGNGGSGATTYTATAVVTSGGVPVPGVVVSLSGGTVNTSNPTGIIATQVTDQQGQAVFTGLTKGVNYCFTATRISGGSSQQVVACSNTGQTTIQLKM